MDPRRIVDAVVDVAESSAAAKWSLRCPRRPNAGRPSCAIMMLASLLGSVCRAGSLVHAALRPGHSDSRIIKLRKLLAMAERQNDIVAIDWRRGELLRLTGPAGYQRLTMQRRAARREEAERKG